jgi:hypothetical protein
MRLPEFMSFFDPGYYTSEYVEKIENRDCVVLAEFDDNAGLNSDEIKASVVAGPAIGDRLRPILGIPAEDQRMGLDSTSNGLQFVSGLTQQLNFQPHFARTRPASPSGRRLFGLNRLQTEPESGPIGNKS